MSLNLVHPAVHMPETKKFNPEVLLRVFKNVYVVAHGTYHEGDESNNRIGTRWVGETGKVFPQSRGYATWDLIPEDDEEAYLQYLLNLEGTDKIAALNLLKQYVP